jgi:hypothetical protein
MDQPARPARGGRSVNPARRCLKQVDRFRIALADGSTGAHVSGNQVNPRIGKLITFDDGNESAGYSGPQPDK